MNDVRNRARNHLRREGGAALALLLLLIAALAGLGVGSLALARRQAVAARSGARVLQAVLAAESGLAVATASMDDGPEAAVGSTVPIGSGSLGTEGRYDVDARRLTGELWHLESTGLHTASGARHRAAAIVWRLEPASRVGVQSGVVLHGEGLTVTGDGRVPEADAHAVPADWAVDACDPFRPVIDSLFPAGTLPAEAPLTDAAPSAWDRQDRLRAFDPVLGPEQSPGLGLIGLDSLLAVGETLGSTLSEPCSTGEDGEPGCAAVPGLLVGSGAATLGGGSATAIVAFVGDLTLTGDAHVAGWLLVSGSLTVSGDARVDGLVRAGGGVWVGDRGAIVGSPCAGLAVLENPWLRRPRAIPGGALLGPLP